MHFYTIDSHHVLFENSLKLSNLYYLSVTQIKGTMCVSLKGNINFGSPLLDLYLHLLCNASIKSIRKEKRGKY